MAVRVKCFFLTAVMFLSVDARSASQFLPGEIWPDNNGVHINAHGAGILFHSGTYYWFGEHKIRGRRGNTAQVGVHCYSSTDLYNWHDEGIVLAVSEDPDSDIIRGCIIERPKVIYNEKTNKFVMWFHLELRGRGYRAARSAVAVADSVTGPYTFLRSFRPDGRMARDMTLFVDDDAKAYHLYASEDNETFHISLLTDDYLAPGGRFERVFIGRYMEAPAVCKRKGKYYFIGSGCTGWSPNAARSAVAESIWGPWKELGNPCVGVNPQNGLGKEKTFGCQSTFILPVQGKEDAFIVMFDMWRPRNPIDGRYVWLPMQFTQEGFSVTWRDKWDLSVFDKPSASAGRRKQSSPTDVNNPQKGLSLADMPVHDPFILPHKQSLTYYLYTSALPGETGLDRCGVMTYKSKDLLNWDGPYLVFVVPDGIWADPMHGAWAPEVHEYKGRYYLFVTLHNRDKVIAEPPKVWRLNHMRGTVIAVGDSPSGPFELLRPDGPHTPKDFMTLDGTLYIDADGRAWMVYCHEWIQVIDGTMEAVRLSDDLSGAVGEPIHLFKASDTPWINAETTPSVRQRHYVTDGPQLYRTGDDCLLMFWSSYNRQGYVQTIARSKSGKIAGPWEQLEPLVYGDSGHGMLFNTFEGGLLLILHQPFRRPLARAKVYEMEDVGDRFRVVRPREDLHGSTQH